MKKLLAIKFQLLFLVLFNFNFLLAQTDSEIVNKEATEYFSTKIEHPYLWLENSSDDKVSDWLQKQKDFSSEYFNKTAYSRFKGRLNANVLYQKKATSEYTYKVKYQTVSPPVLLREDNITMSFAETILKCTSLKRNEHDFPMIENFWVSEKLNIVVTAISHSGSDWLDFIIIDLDDFSSVYTLGGIIIPWLEFTKDGFYYECYDVPDNPLYSIRENQRISFHKINTSQEEDRTVFTNQDATNIRLFDFIKPGTSENIYVFHSLKRNGSWYRALSAINVNDPYDHKPILVYKSPVRLEFDFVYESTDSVYFRTNMNSSSFNVIKVSLKDLNGFQDFIPGYQEVLTDVQYLGNNIFGLVYLDHGTYIGRIIDKSLQTKLIIQAPTGASVNFNPSFTGQYAYMDISTYYLFPEEHTIDLTDMSISDPEEENLISRNTYKSILTEYENKDGEKVPIHIVYASNKVKMDGSNPAMIKVYGGYGYIPEPHFSWENYTFIKNGGILIFPSVRGSGALGTNWALEGRGKNKQNTIDDIIDAAEFVIANKYTNPDKLIIQGASHGGFAVSAAAIQRPDLFKGVIVNSGVFDLIRRLGQSVGYLDINRDEYGDPADSLSFTSRLNLSPIHSLKQGIDYPSFLVFVGSNDTRVHPSNSYRFMAMLNEKSSNKLNFLHVSNGGHSLTENPQEGLAIMSLKFSFIYLLTGEKLWF